MSSAGFPLVGSETDDPRLRATFEQITAATGRVANLYQALGQAPILLQAWIDFAWTLRAECEVPRNLRELAILRVAGITDTPYEIVDHVPMARAAGVSDAQLAALDGWQASTVFDALERLVLAAAEELTTTTALSPETRGLLLTELGEQQTVELVLTIAFYSCVSRVLKGLDVPLHAQGTSQGL